MKIILFFVALFVVSSVRSHGNHYEHAEKFGSLQIGGKHFDDRDAFIRSGGRCGNMAPSEADKQRSTDIMKKYANRIRRERSTAFTPPVVETWFHVITSSKGEGYLSPQDVDAQMKAMNDAYASTGFSFYLAGVSCIASDDWYAGNITTTANQEMKTLLRRGKSATLNIFFKPLDGLLGYSSMPGWYDLYPWDDGVVIIQSSIPGGSSFPYNLGYTAVHEVGHWLGLFHPFEGNNCRNGQKVGDHVVDTPAQKTYTGGCPAFKNSCPGRPGEDSIHNYMDYSDDSCMNQFTSGQATFMAAMWQEYRQVDYVVPEQISTITSISCTSP